MSLEDKPAHRASPANQESEPVHYCGGSPVCTKKPKFYPKIGWRCDEHSPSEEKQKRPFG
jgi:hypothetical protein